MGQISQLAKSEILKNEAETFQTYGNMAVQVGKIIGEEGLWIAFSADLFFVLGEVHEDDTVLFLQREVVVQLFKKDGFLDTLRKSIDIPFTSVKIPNPLAPMINFIWPYAEILKKYHRDENGKKVMEAIDPVSRVALTLFIPGIMRTFLKLITSLSVG